MLGGGRRSYSKESKISCFFIIFSSKTDFKQQICILLYISIYVFMYKMNQDSPLMFLHALSKSKERYFYGEWESELWFLIPVWLLYVALTINQVQQAKFNKGFRLYFKCKRPSCREIVREGQTDSWRSFAPTVGVGVNLQVGSGYFLTGQIRCLINLCSKYLFL